MKKEFKKNRPTEEELKKFGKTIEKVMIKLKKTRSESEGKEIAKLMKEESEKFKKIITRREFERLNDEIRETLYYKMMYQLFYSMYPTSVGRYEKTLEDEDRCRIVDHIIDQHLISLWQTASEIPSILMEHKVPGKISNKKKKFSSRGIKKRKVKRCEKGEVTPEFIEEDIYSNYTQSAKKRKKTKVVTPFDKIIEDFIKTKKKKAKKKKKVKRTKTINRR